MGLTPAFAAADWTPMLVRAGDGEPVVEWCHTAGVAFDEPFFDQTLERCLRHPFRLLFRQETTLAELEARAVAAPGITPSGFLLHVSRCGSTLAAAMLATLPSTLVLSEPSPLDAVLRHGRAGPVKAMLAALGQPRTDRHRHLVVKLDAWALLSLPVLRAAFPAVPLVVVHRDPVEVAVSQVRRRGWHAVPGALPPALLGLGPTDPFTLPPDDYVAAVLGALYRAAAAAVRDGALPVDYRDLPAAVPDAVAPRFGISCAAGERRAMLAAATRDAKNPVLAFEEDTDVKQQLASGALREAVDRWARPAYDDLRAAASAATAGAPRP